jgi:TPR repeat protein
MNIDTSEGQPALTPSIWWYFDKSRVVWDALPRAAIILYVLFLCSLFQVTYWEQLGVNVWEHMTVYDAAGRCVVPMCIIFAFLLICLAPRDQRQPLLKIDFKKPSHRGFHIAFRVVSLVGLTVLVFFDLSGTNFSPISSFLTTLPMFLLAVVLMAIPSTDEAQETVKRWPHLQAAFLVFVSILFSAGAGRLLGGLKTCSEEPPEVVFTDNDLALKLSWFSFAETIGGKHVFISIYPTRKTVLVNSSYVKAVIYNPPKYNPRQVKDAERGKNGEEEYLVALSAFTGRNAAQDPKQGFDWLLKSANAGNLRASYHLALCYRDGDGVLSDAKLFLYWLRKAAEWGSADAQFLLSMMYWRGDGMPLDKEASFKWLLASAIGGDNRAQRLIPLYFESGVGTQVNSVKAQAWRLVSGESKDDNLKGFDPHDELSRSISDEVNAIKEAMTKRARPAK